MQRLANTVDIALRRILLTTVTVAPAPRRRQGRRVAHLGQRIDGLPWVCAAGCAKAPLFKSWGWGGVPGSGSPAPGRQAGRDVAAALALRRQHVCLWQVVAELTQASNPHCYPPAWPAPRPPADPALRHSMDCRKGARQALVLRQEGVSGPPAEQTSATVHAHVAT